MIGHAPVAYEFLAQEGGGHLATRVPYTDRNAMTKRKGALDKLLPPRIDVDADEGAVFREAMEGVRRLKSKTTVPRPNGSRNVRLEGPNSDSEIRLLLDFLSGRADFEWSFHPGYQEGGAEFRNRPLLRKLRRGAYSIQAELDLHGMTQVEAHAALESFLVRCSKRNLRCVRVVHGKGNNSRRGEGILKKRVPQWLATRRLGRYVIAYTSAPPTDGGIGATYVLLRKSGD
jgi:DNA-nicking Smr family endonuclease